MREIYQNSIQAWTFWTGRKKFFKLWFQWLAPLQYPAACQKHKQIEILYTHQLQDNVQVFCNRTPTELRAYKQSSSSHQCLAVTLCWQLTSFTKSPASQNSNDWKCRNPIHFNVIEMFIIHSTLFDNADESTCMWCEDFVWQSQCWDVLHGLEQLGCSVKGIVFWTPLR